MEQLCACVTPRVSSSQAATSSRREQIFVDIHERRRRDRDRDERTHTAADNTYNNDVSDTTISSAKIDHQW
jgi:hypothetical protein